MAQLVNTSSSALTGSTATYLTVTAGTAFLLKEIVLCNTDSSSRTVTVYFVPVSGSPATSNTVLPGVSVPAGSTVRFAFNTALEASATIQALASVAAVVTIRISGIQFTTPSILAPQTPNTLGVGASTFYTVTTAKTGIVKEIILANTDSVSRTVTVYLDGSATANKILSAVSITAATVLVLPMDTVLAAAGTVQALASSAGVVAIRVSATEHS